MNLVVISHKLYYEYQGCYTTTGAAPIQMDVLAPYFDRITLCVPVQKDTPFHGTACQALNIRFHPLPVHRGRWDFLRLLPQYVRAIRKALTQADVILVMLPGYIGALGSIMARRSNIPMFQMIVSDWGKLFRVRSKSPTRRLVAPMVSLLINSLMQYLTSGVLCFYTGKVLYNVDDPLQNTRVSSSISDGNIYARSDTCQSPPYRLLFVGRLVVEKGVSYLLQAVSALRNDRFDIELHIVGDGILQSQLEAEAEALDVASQTQFWGFVPQGEPLSKLYRASDMLILPSLQEQQGKVLLEAMANSLPIIASNIGGIPTIVRHEWNGLLVPPCDPCAISQAIARLIKDGSLRKRLINKGLEFARQHTVERETEKMMHIVRSHYPHLFASFRGETKGDLS